MAVKKKKTTKKKKTKSRVNEAGNYTKPELRKRLFNEIWGYRCVTRSHFGDAFRGYDN